MCSLSRQICRDPTGLTHFSFAILAFRRAFAHNTQHTSGLTNLWYCRHQAKASPVKGTIMRSGLSRCKHGIIPLAAAIVATASCAEKHPQVAATPPPVVEVALPVKRTVTDYQVFTARTQAVESVNITARVKGYRVKY